MESYGFHNFFFEVESSTSNWRKLSTNGYMTKRLTGTLSEIHTRRQLHQRSRVSGSKMRSKSADFIYYLALCSYYAATVS